MGLLGVLLNPTALLAILAALSIGVVGGCVHGESVILDAWDKEKAEARAAATTDLAVRTEVKTEVVTKYVERVTVVTEKADEIIREVPVLVRADERVSAGFVCVTDRGALNDPGAPCVLDEAAGGAGADRAAEVIVRNYGRYHELAEQVKALQEYVSRVCIGDPSVAAGPIGVGGAPLSRDGPPPSVAAGPSFQER